MATTAILLVRFALLMDDNSWLREIGSRFKAEPSLESATLYTSRQAAEKAAAASRFYPEPELMKVHITWEVVDERKEAQ